MLSVWKRRAPWRSWYAVCVVLLAQLVIAPTVWAAQSQACTGLNMRNDPVWGQNFIFVIRPEQFKAGDTFSLTFQDNGTYNGTLDPDMIVISPYDNSRQEFAYDSSAKHTGTQVYTMPDGYGQQHGMRLRVKVGTDIPHPVFTCTSVADPVAISPTLQNQTEVGASYNASLSATGGTGSFTFSVTGGSLPDGLRLETNGVLHGQPTTVGSSTFTVTARDTDGATASHTYTVTVQAGKPGMVTAVSAIAGDRSATVSFTAPTTDGGAPISYYAVIHPVHGTLATGAASPILVQDLTNGEPIDFHVVAYNTDGKSSASSMVSNAVTPYGSQVITFTPPADVSFGQTGQLDASSDRGLPVSFSTLTPSVCSVDTHGLVQPLLAGTCTIAADQAGDAGHAAATRVVRSLQVREAAPGEPLNQRAVLVTGSSADVFFDAPASNGGTQALDYVVRSQPGNLTVSGHGSPIRVSGLAAQTTYTFTVSAVGNAGTGPASAPTNAVTTASAATVAAVRVPAPRRYQAGDALDFVVEFDRPVHGAGAPLELDLRIGGERATAQYVSGLGTAAIHLRYVVQPGDADHDGIEIERLSSLSPLRGEDGYEAQIGLHGVDSTSGVLVGSAMPSAPREVQVTPRDGRATVNFVPPVMQGASPIIGYRVTAQPGNHVVVGPSSPLEVQNLVAGTVYTFSVVAINAHGESVPNSVNETAVDTLRVDDVTLAVPYQTATDVVFAVTGGLPGHNNAGPATYPTHGRLSTVGKTVRYHPDAGYAGPDSFTYYAENGIDTSGSATVSITVGAPTILFETASLEQASGGTPYNVAMRMSGGAWPYSYAVVGGALPAGVQLSTQGQLAGTPTVAGSFTFEVEVTDSTTGSGPFSVRRSYTLVVAAPEIVLSPEPLPEVIQADDVNRRLLVSGGAAPYAFRLKSGGLPPGLTLAEDGTLEGTATQAGTFEFEVEVTDANGFVATSTYRMQVAQALQEISGFAAQVENPAYAEGGTFTVEARGGASSQPVVIASTTPAICSVTGTTVTMLAAGRCTLTADQAGDANHKAAAQQRLDIDIAAGVPTLAWETELTQMFGQGSFDLPLPVSPSQGAFTFHSSNADVASINGRTVTIHGEGTVVITAHQAAWGSYAATSVELRLVVAQRPDPTRDADVAGLLQAQVDASVRFATAQQANIRDRLRQVRNGDNSGRNGINLSNGNGGRSAASLPLGELGGTGSSLLPPGWGSWASGTATWGRGGANRNGRYDLRTDGLTVGVDRALGEQMLFGVAGSVGRNDSELDSASRMRADQRSLALYGLWRVSEHVFVDGMVATGSLEFDLRRESRDVDGMATASRDGDQWFGSLGVGYEQDVGGMRMTGYGRYDANRSTLDAYREQGLGAYDLAYGRHIVENRALAVGLEGAVQGGADARVRPFWSIEYRHALQDRGTASLNYAQWAHAQDYSVAMRSYNDNALSLSAGVDVQLQRGWLLSLLFGHEQARASDRSSSVGLRLSMGGRGGAVEQPVEPGSVD